MISISNLTSKKSEKNYIFSDIDLHFEESRVSKNRKTGDSAPGLDLVISKDEEAIKNSIRNLLLQTRHLTDMNANLKGYIGEPITEFRGLALGEDLQRVINLYEPRILVEKILVGTNIDASTYNIRLMIKIKNLGTSLTLNATFDRNGNFNFINNYQ